MTEPRKPKKKRPPSDGATRDRSRGSKRPGGASRGQGKSEPAGWGKVALLIGAVCLLLLGPPGLLAGWALLAGPGTGKQVQLEWPGPLGPGETADRLAEVGLVRSAFLMGLYLRVAGGTPFEPGAHLVTDGLTPRELVRLMARVPGRTSVKLTIPEGWHHLQIAQRLEERGVCGREAFRRAVADRTLLDELGLRGESAEGYLFPATYDLALDSDPRAVVKRLVAATRKRLTQLQAKHPEAMKHLLARGWGEREVLTLASIVEKETMQAEERATVAGVYTNRLTDPSFVPRAMLQADPTAGYGCALEPEAAPSCSGYRGLVTPAMIRDPANRFNTYRHAGLPPGPICNPGSGAIEAALEPARTDFLYFVATGNGRHTFSRTLEEHNAAIRQGRRSPPPD